MKEGPDIAQIGALIGDPARANMLTALMAGRALTATELAEAGGITLQTASGHLAKLEAGGLVGQRKQGRHRYFTLADEVVGKLLEGIMGEALGDAANRHLAPASLIEHGAAGSIERDVYAHQITVSNVG